MDAWQGVGHAVPNGPAIENRLEFFDDMPALKLLMGAKAKLHGNLNLRNLPSERQHLKSLPLNLSRRRSPMEVFSGSGILEVIAVTLAVVMMLGPLVPYAIIGRRARRRAR
jgi:hypothetical protein